MIDRNAFEVGDRVRATGGFTGTITSITGQYAVVRNSVEVANEPLKNLRFACHNHGCPAANKVFDLEKSYADGYNSGYYFARLKRIYAAGGPCDHAPNDRDCKHINLTSIASQENNCVWREGWKKGQTDMTKVDWKKPVRTLEGLDVHIICHDYKEFPDSKPTVQLRVREKNGWGPTLSVDPKTGVTQLGYSGERHVFVNTFVLHFHLTSEGTTFPRKPNITATFDADGNLVDVRKI